MRAMITFSYDGTNFHGFERQPDYRTIQEEMENVLKYINNDQNTFIIASGRTDKGVHAINQVCHVDINVNITEYKLKRAINSLLPEDIHVISTKFIEDDFHARYMVKEKIYEYKLNMGEYNPCDRNYIYQFNRELDINKIEKVIKYFIGVHDFKAFTPNKDKRENYVREIYDASIKVNDNIVTFTFRGNGFIKYQIRNMVGLLIEIGLHRKDESSVLEILESKNRSNHFRTSHPEGLYLKEVIY
ncbi:MAG: tRNA pseudouridine(38-40) synthase TruA [Bacilli bacterium]|nr:tRNA pseudouridine(38-40) synthase TruA [Bacilli bacterium]